MSNCKSILAWICVDFKLPLRRQSWHWNMWTPISREIARSFIKGQCEWLYILTQRMDGSVMGHSPLETRRPTVCEHRNKLQVVMRQRMCFRPAFRYPLRYLCCSYSAFHAAGWQYKELILTLLMCFCLAWERFEPLVLAPLSGLTRRVWQIASMYSS